MVKYMYHELYVIAHLNLSTTNFKCMCFKNQTALHVFQIYRQHLNIVHFIASDYTTLNRLHTVLYIIFAVFVPFL